jgi:hypothetical protein
MDSSYHRRQPTDVVAAEMANITTFAPIAAQLERAVSLEAMFPRGAIEDVARRGPNCSALRPSTAWPLSRRGREDYMPGGPPQDSSLVPNGLHRGNASVELPLARCGREPREFGWIRSRYRQTRYYRSSIVARRQRHATPHAPQRGARGLRIASAAQASRRRTAIAPTVAAIAAPASAAAVGLGRWRAALTAR